MRALFFIIFVGIIASFRCNAKDNECVAGSYAACDTSIFSMPIVPDSLKSVKLRANYVVLNFWHHLRTSKQLSVDDKHELEQAFVNYISVLPMADTINVSHSAEWLMNAVAANTELNCEVLGLAEKYLYELSSPCRNEDFFKAILTDASLGKLTEAEQFYWKRLKKLLSSNNPGQPANDFVITYQNGAKHKLSEIEADYLILFFNNPDCEECVKMKNTLAKQSFPQNCKIVSVYPDDDIRLWKESLTTVPADWISGYDEGLMITNDDIYDLRSLPVLYLLDKGKEVIIKNAKIDRLQEFFRNNK